MTKNISLGAFVIGLAVIAWMGLGFITTNLLAFGITFIIAIVFAIGFMELNKFQQATNSLIAALESQSQEMSEQSSFDQWLGKIDASLRHSVELRIESGQTALPAPVLTPYLVGLLVMLGLLGTFVGMVDTLQGAVIALQGNSELQAIREGLATPIEGLGLAFGTSVAGISGSAMLGLISTLSRKDRLLATRVLDSKIHTIFRPFSQANSRDELMKALQAQALALPDVAETLNNLASQIENMSSAVNQQLVDNQQELNKTTSATFETLAANVQQSLESTLSQSTAVIAENVSENIQPIMQRAMDAWCEESTSSQQKMQSIAEEQLGVLTTKLSENADTIQGKLATAYDAQQQHQQGLLDELKQHFKDQSQSLLEQIETSQAQQYAQLQQKEIDRNDVLMASFKTAGENLSEHSNRISESVSEKSETAISQMQQLLEQSEKLVVERVNGEKALIESQKASIESINTNVSNQLQALNEAEQKRVSSIVDTLSEQFSKLHGSEQARIESLTQTIEEQLNTLHSAEQSRISAINETLESKLTALHNAEQERGLAREESIAQLETMAKNQLQELGKALEEPMLRLIDSASVAPKAAAEVIEQLRNEISKNIEKDNDLLAERQQSLESLQQLSQSLNQSIETQQQSVNDMAESSGQALSNIADRFESHVTGEVEKLSTVVDQFSTSAVEMASLGEMFNLGVGLFGDSNQAMMDQLALIQAAMETSSTRSDEQLEYYVAQAREIIDHSMLVQQELMQQLKQITQAEISQADVDQQADEEALA